MSSLKKTWPPRNLMIHRQEDPKGEKSSQSSSTKGQTLIEEQLNPFELVRRLRWFEQTFKDAWEHVEAPRTTFRESRPPRKFPTYMALITNIIDLEPSSFEEATSQ